MAKLVRILFFELRAGWVTATLIVLIVAALTGALAFLDASAMGLEREISRTVRDLGSNIAIIPSSASLGEYHRNGGFTLETMPMALVERLTEERLSLNHLIAMLDVETVVTVGDSQRQVHVVGLAASQAVPGRPKAPMQKALKQDTAQLGHAVAAELGLADDSATTLSIAGKDFKVTNVNRATGGWQDSAVLIDLEQAQSLFNQPDRVTRIEAVECTDEKCAATGMTPDVVLADELAKVTNEAKVVRRRAMADGRGAVRFLAGSAFRLTSGSLWLLLVVAVAGLVAANTFQRRSEIALLKALGYGAAQVGSLFVLRALLLVIPAAVAGVVVGNIVVKSQLPALLTKTVAKFEPTFWDSAPLIGYAVVLAALAALIPAMWATTQQPANVLGRQP